MAPHPTTLKAARAIRIAIHGMTCACSRQQKKDGDHEVSCHTNAENSKWLDRVSALDAAEIESHCHVSEMVEALTEILALYPSSNTIHALEAIPPHPRPCPSATTTDKQVLAWREVLAKVTK